MSPQDWQCQDQNTRKGLFLASSFTLSLFNNRYQLVSLLDGSLNLILKQGLQAGKPQTNLPGRKSWRFMPDPIVMDQPLSWRHAHKLLFG